MLINYENIVYFNFFDKRNTYLCKNRTQAKKIFMLGKNKYTILFVYIRFYVHLTESFR